VFNRTTWEEGVIAAAEVADAAGLPFVLTEMSAGLNNAYDAPFAASFLVHTAAAFLGVPNVPTLSFWTFTDVFEERGMNSVPYAETYGMQTKWGVPKPSYRALQLIARLPTTGVPVVAVAGTVPNSASRRGAAAGATATSGTVDVITTVDASLGTTLRVSVLVTNFNMNIKDTEDPSQGLPIVPATVTLAFALPTGATPSANATLTLLDSTHGWAKPTWLAAGSPTYPNASQIEAEMQASTFGITSAPLALAGNTLTLALPIMEPYAVVLVEFELLL
jgi:xylan 1,4-beta-xylosidase